ncbi:MAG: winged helix DNA-binding domain-containing protein [Actinomycetes bacterium]
MSLSREQVLGFRAGAQGLDRKQAALDDTRILDIGVQDTGPDGALWALALRGVDVHSLDDDELALLWTVRGAPHLYRPADLPSVAAAVAPFSEADAAKRIYDAAKPLRAAGIPVLEALDTVAGAMRSVVTTPTVKGEVSARVAELMDEPYLRFCRPCDATHLYEMPFRLAALRGGLELRPGTSPPVLQRIPDFRAALHPEDRHDVVRAYLRLLGPATPKLVAGYLDAPVKDVAAHWPDDAVDVLVDGEKRFLLAADLDAALADRPPAVVRLLGPFDLFLQAQDRSLLVDDPARRKALWPVLGRPGAVLHGSRVVGTWRPRKAGSRLTVSVEMWDGATAAVRDGVAEQAERLAEHRGLQLSDLQLGL